MTDERALEVIKTTKMVNEEYIEALIHAAKKLESLRWRTYNPENFSNSYSLSYGMRVHLGIRFSDGSRGCVEGMVVYDIHHEWKLEISHNSSSIFTTDAVIEKWMPYPDYNENS